MQKVSTWKTLAHEQSSGDLIWELTRNYSSFLVKSQDLTLSRDPLNLTGLNTKRDSGLANSKAFGIGIEQSKRKVRERKAKKDAKVVRFTLRIKTRRRIPKKRLVGLKEKTLPEHNNLIYSERKRITTRAIVKAFRRDLSNARKDLLPLAFKKLRKLHKFKRANKKQNRAEAKKVKA